MRGRVKMKKEIIKVATVTSLSIGILGSSFVGINQFVLANAMNQSEAVTPITTNVSANKFQTLENRGQDLRIIETSLKEELPSETFERIKPYVSFEKSENTLSTEEAAQIGAQIIEALLGENVEGMVVEMNYSQSLSHGTPIWQGRVANSEAEIANRQHSFDFSIHGVTGEILSINNLKNLVTTQEAVKQAVSAPTRVLTETQIEIARQAVTEFAQTHFTDSEINRVQFIAADWMGTVQNDAGDYVPEWNAIFDIVDATGRVAAATVSVDSQTIRHFSTFTNELTLSIDMKSDFENPLIAEENRQAIESVLTTGETIKIYDNTMLAAQMSPNLDFELAAHNLSLEEAAEVGAQLIKETFGENVDGMTFQKGFWHAELGGREFWNGIVSDADGNELFYYLIDARTGDEIELSMNTEATPFIG